MEVYRTRHTDGTAPTPDRSRRRHLHESTRAFPEEVVIALNSPGPAILLAEEISTPVQASGVPEISTTFCCVSSYWMV